MMQSTFLQKLRDRIQSLCTKLLCITMRSAIAKISHVNRHPGIFFSFRNTWYFPLAEAFRAWVNYHPFIIEKLWFSVVGAANRHQGHERFISIRFQGLLEQPGETVQRLCQFSGMEFEQECLTSLRQGSQLVMTSVISLR